MKKLKITLFAEQKRKAQQPSDLILLIKKAFADVQESSLIANKPLIDLPHLVEMANKFNMSFERAVVFASIYCITENESKLTERGITSFLKHFFVNNSRAVRMEIRELKRIGLICMLKDEGLLVYFIDSRIMQSLDENDLDAIVNIGPVGLEASMEFVRKKLMDHDTLSGSEVLQYLDDIKQGNPDLTLIKYCEEKYFFSTIYDAYLCLAVCAKAVIDNDAFDFSYMESYVNVGRRYIQVLRQEVLSQSWAPIEEGYIEIAGGNTMDFNPQLILTAKGYDFFLKELDPEFLKMIRTKIGALQTPLIQPKDIQKVSLFFDDEFKDRTERIASLLQPETFKKYQDSFPKAAKMKGMTLLFHGLPGCGKTEFALQLSKITGRPLMKIEVTDFQSKWVGESEKRLRGIFKDYRMACERSEIQPLLFFNEADQIIGKRVAIRNSVDQMTNALQNIVLEEMENFDGILIGTTNLTDNMDSAFERRWVMKLHFESPNNQAKQAIWKSAIKALRVSEAETLVRKFDFTPGEITNIARRFSVEKLLGLKSTRLDVLMTLCESERYNSGASTKSIGFTFEKSLQQKAKAN